MAEKTGFHLSVKGRVQGVGFRYYCREAASRLGLTGYVMNMPDGSVEIEVFGDGSLVDSFISEISKDMMFDIDEITRTTVPDDKGYRDFYIQHYPGY